MPIQFKFADKVAPEHREEIARALRNAGFASRSLFDNHRLPALAAIQTIPVGSEDDLATVKRVLKPFGNAIEYVEVAPRHTLKSG